MSPKWFVGLDVGPAWSTLALGRFDERGCLELHRHRSLPNRGASLLGADARGYGIGSIPLLIDWLQAETGGVARDISLLIPEHRLRCMPTCVEHRWPQPIAISPALIGAVRRSALQGPALAGPVVGHVLRDLELDSRSVSGFPLQGRAARLRARFDAWVAPARTLAPLAALMEARGVRLDVLVPSAIAAAEVTLQPRERELGVLAVLIGQYRTDVAVFGGNRLIGLFSVPNDGAAFDCVQTELRAASRRAPVAGSGRGEPVVVEASENDPRIRVAEPCVPEIFRRIRHQLEERDLYWRVLAGAVLTGLGAGSSSTLEAAREELGRPTRPGRPLMSDAKADELDPAIVPLIGALVYQAKIHDLDCTAAATGTSDFALTKRDQSSTADSGANQPMRRGLTPALGRWLREFVPLGEA